MRQIFNFQYVEMPSAALNLPLQREFANKLQKTNIKLSKFTKLSNGASVRLPGKQTIFRSPKH